MSFISKGATLYLSQPTASSNEHVVQEVSGTIMLFVNLPSGTGSEETDVGGTIVPELLVTGTIVG